MSKNVKKYVAPDGKEFKIKENAVRYMNDNNLPGSLTVIITNPKTETKKQEIYFLPIFGLRLVEQIIKQMPEEINNFYGFDELWWPQDDGNTKLDILQQTQKGQHWEFLAWILMRIPEHHDKPIDYFNDVYDKFLQGLREDMKDNNELYGHHKSCTEYYENHKFILNYWKKHTPKEGYGDVEDRAKSKARQLYEKSRINLGDLGAKRLTPNEMSKYFNEPLYYHKTHGWGLALTPDELRNYVIGPLSILSQQKVISRSKDKRLHFKRGHEVITPTDIIPQRLKPMGKLELILRPLLLTQGIYCPCRCSDVVHLKSLESTISDLLNKRLLFKITDDGFGSLKLINWPYDDPQI